MSVNFDDILNKSADDIEAPKPLPQGTYLGQITGAPELDNFESLDKQTGAKRVVRVAKFNIALLEPLGDVDSDLLEKAGGLQRKDGKPRVQQATYYLDEENLYKIKNLGKTLGINFKTLGELFEQVQGCEVKVSVIQQPSRAPGDDSIYNRVAKVIGTAAKE